MTSEALVERRANRNQFIKSAGKLAGTYVLGHTSEAFSAKIVTPADLDSKMQIPGEVKLDPIEGDNLSPFIAYVWAHATDKTITSEFMLALKAMAEEQGANTDIVYLGQSISNPALLTHLATFEF